MNSAEQLRSQILLSLQRALLGKISKDIRAITCVWDASKIVIKSFHDGKVSDEDREDMEVTGSEVAADVPKHLVEVECVRADYPEKLTASDRAIWAYQRKEP